MIYTTRRTSRWHWRPQVHQNQPHPFDVVHTRTLCVTASPTLRYEGLAVEYETNCLALHLAAAEQGIHIYERTGVRAHVVLAERDFLAKNIFETLSAHTLPVTVGNDNLVRFITIPLENLNPRGLSSMWYGALTAEINNAHILIDIGQVIETPVLLVNLPDGSHLVFEIGNMLPVWRPISHPRPSYLCRIMLKVEDKVLPNFSSSDCEVETSVSNQAQVKIQIWHRCHLSTQLTEATISDAGMFADEDNIYLSTDLM